ncbi:glycosyltransferase family 2 protein [Apilactobacillus apisilvae]|uniref:Glycosyltransferase family 2 protein n=1 Tax=Apilactobacillus apisilvae TaxID=2923364 RepID=A0ABY4PG90_9LACO|nr:glycosyltransferase family 2 protein [Apilactobacillus apisilvae]UQS84607.1 glycosyltransferase family 2 protein [Apilactobacillus apisilvae]
METNQELISIVLPVFNEESGIQNTIEILQRFIAYQPEKYELIFVDDGSKDKSADIIKKQKEKYPTIKLIEFSRNFGHQLAITAGIKYAKGNAVIVMDADLQDPPSVIPNMIKKWHDGYDVVYGKRLVREGESIFKKFTAKMFYRLMKSISNIEIPLDTGDFRLMDAKVVKELNKLKEPEPFVRGLVSWVGFKQTSVQYERQERTAGESKYPLSKMIRLASDGITSFSAVPLKIMNYASIFSILIGFIYGLVKIFNHFSSVDFATCSMFILSGIIMFGLGTVGNYLFRTFDASKQRPQYIIANRYGFDYEKNKKYLKTLKQNNG